MSSAITSIVTRSRLCPPTSSWPRTPGCRIPGFIRWTCAPLVREAGGLGEGVWGGYPPRGAASPLPAQPQPPTTGSITNLAKKCPASIWARAPSATRFLQMFTDFFMLAFAPCCMSHAAAFVCTKGCPGGWPWLPTPDPDPAGSHAWEKPFLPGWGRRVPPRARGGRRKEPEEGAVWSAFCNYTGKFISVSQWQKIKKMPRNKQDPPLTHNRFHKVNNLVHNLLRI